MAKLLHILLLILISAVALSGCSGSDDDTYLAGPEFDDRVVSESGPIYIPGNNTDTEFVDENTQHERQRSIMLTEHQNEVNPEKQ